MLIGGSLVTGGGQVEVGDSIVTRCGVRDHGDAPDIPAAGSQGGVRVGS